MIPIARLPNLLSSGIEFNDNARFPVHIKYVVLVVEIDSMRVDENPLSPGLEKVSVAIENEYGMFGSRANMHPIPIVHRHCADLAPFVTLRKFAPTFGYIISVCSTPNCYRHSIVLLLLCNLVQTPCDQFILGCFLTSAVEFPPGTQTPALPAPGPRSSK